MSIEILSGRLQTQHRYGFCSATQSSEPLVDTPRRAGFNQPQQGARASCGFEVGSMAEKVARLSARRARASAKPETPKPLRDSLGFLLNRAGVAVGNGFSQELKMAGMTLAMWRVLAALHDTGNQNLSSLSEFISVEISTLSRQITTLAGRGLVVNQPCGKNWRSIDISLTPAGRAVVQRLRPATERHERAALDGIKAKDIVELKRLLIRIYDNLCALDTVLPVMTADADLDSGIEPMKKNPSDARRKRSRETAPQRVRRSPSAANALSGDPTP